MTYLKWWKGKTYNQEYPTQQGSHSDLMSNQKLYRQAKAKSVQHHQDSFTTNVKEISLGEKEKATVKNKNVMKWKISSVKTNKQ